MMKLNRDTANVKKVYVCYKKLPDDHTKKENQIIFKHRVHAQLWVKQNGGEQKAGFDELPFVLR